MKIYHNPRCGKSREALKLLNEKGIEPEIILYLKDVPTVDELSDIVRMLDIQPEELIRKNEAIYKELFKNKTMSHAQWIEAMVEYPKLIERPIIINGAKAVIGRPASNISSLL